MPNPTGVGADPSDSEQDDDVDYEEIEVEEEVEEEVDDDDDDEQQIDEEDDDDFGQYLSPVNEDTPEDVGHDIKTTGKEELYNSVSLNQKNPTDRDSVGVYKGPSMTAQMDTAEEEESRIENVNLKYSELGKVVIASKDLEFQESSVVGKRILKDHGDAHSYNNKAPLDGDMILSGQTSEPSSKSGDELTAAVSVKSNFIVEANGTQYSEEETKRMYLQSEDIKHRISRLDVPSVPRSLSPGTNFKVGNKRPAIICDFFAKGWCIKGKSCRFLHITDPTSQQIVEVEADANQKIAQRTSEGSERCSEKAQLDSLLDVAPSSAVGTSHSMERDLLRELGQGSRLKDESEELQSSKEDNKSIPSFNNVGRENWYLRDYGKYNSEEMTGKRSQFMFDGPTFPLNNHSLSTSSSTSLHNVSGALPSTYIPNLSRSSMSFGSPSWNLDPPGSDKHSLGNREHGSSRFTLLQHSSSPFSGSETEKPYWRDVSGDFIRSGGYKTKKTSYSWEYNWEPSEPFRLSSSITQSLLSSVNQYDPIRDSIEPPKSRDRLLKSSTSSQGLSGPESNLGKRPTSGHYLGHENVLDNKNYGKDSISAKADTVATPVVDPQNRHALVKEEEKPLRTANVKYIKKGGTINTDHDYINQTDRLIEKTKKMEPNGQTSAIDVDPQADEDMLRESKAKHFRVALIDFVKELVKPTWREGNLSKDAHKMIVKRAVDKVLSTLLTHQIPCTTESVKLYLSSSQPKIAKLVEGYIEKYGKL